MDIALNNSALKGKTVLLTGGGGGIGFEAAKAFAQMGAKVLVAEINSKNGLYTAEYINSQSAGSAEFFYIDLSNQAEVQMLCKNISEKYGCPDIIFNNATIVVTGRIGEVSVAEWEQSFAVNLKAPVMLTSLFLDEMKKRGSGCIVFVSSSGAAPYLSAYETFKTAQAEFSSALSMELENTGVYTYTIGPGLVKTATAEQSIKAVAAEMGMTTKEFYSINESHILSAAEAGAGFAVSVLKAEEYHGQEISSIQALNDYTAGGEKGLSAPQNCGALLQHAELLNKIADTYNAQYEGWQSRNVFERRWVLRDFKKTVGMPADGVQNEFKKLKQQLSNGEQPSVSKALLEKLVAYWQHQYKLLQGFEKDKQKLKEYSETILDWISDIQAVLDILED